jgi:glucose 1-dehydrogenase
MRLEGKRVLVTGSSRGIGRAIAERFAREGADVIINYFADPEGPQASITAVQSAGRRAVALEADVGDVAAVGKLIDDAWEALGGLDVLVNNAGIEKRAPFCDVTEADFDTVLRVNLKGVFFATQAFVRRLRAESRGGKVINISSVHEELPFPNFAPYCASKGGVRMLTRDLAVELGPFGITINSIAPGAIATSINNTLLHDAAKVQALTRQIPLGRLGDTGDVAGLAAFLASADANYATGATYFVDGGLTWFYQEQ